MKKIIYLLVLMVSLCSCSSTIPQETDICISTSDSTPMLNITTKTTSIPTETISVISQSNTDLSFSPTELAVNSLNTDIFIDKYGTEWISCSDDFYITDNSDDNSIIFSRQYKCVNEPHKKRHWKHTAKSIDGEWQVTSSEIDFNYSENFCYRSSINAQNNKITCLKDDKLETEINTFIAETLEEIKPYKEEFLAQYEYDLNSFSDYFLEAPEDIDITIVNGYLSVSIGYFFAGNMEWPRQYYIYKSAVYDIVEGRKIENLGELFPEGFDYEKHIRNYIKTQNPHIADKDIEFIMSSYQFTAEDIIFDYNKNILIDGNMCNFGYYCNEYLKTLKPRKYSQYATCQIYEDEFPLYEDGIVCNTENQLNCYRIISSRYLTNAEIAAINSVFEKIQTKVDSLIPEYNKKQGNDFGQSCWINYEHETEGFRVHVGWFNDAVDIMFTPEGEFIMLNEVLNEDFPFKCEKCGNFTTEHWVQKICTTAEMPSTIYYTCGIDLYDARWNYANINVKSKYIKEKYKK